MVQNNKNNKYKNTKLKVYKNKNLNNAHFSDFNLNEYQVFLHLISNVGKMDNDGKYIQDIYIQRNHTLSALDFAKKFNIKVDNCYNVLKNACKKLMKTSITIQDIEINKIREINVCSMAEYCLSKGKIQIRFTEEIIPYLKYVSKKFVLYNLKEISNFGSLYTTRLYEILVQFKSTGWFIKDIDELRNILGISKDKLKLYSNFKKRAIEHAVNEINIQHNLNLKFKEIKEGKKVVYIRFDFKKSQAKC